MKLLTVSQMRSIEQEADRLGYSYKQMMEKAGKGLSRIIHDRFYSSDSKRILGLIGSGNNGGDALIALADLINKGWEVKAYLAKPRVPDDPLLAQIINDGGTVINGTKEPNGKDLKNSLLSADVLLDGILGTGIKLPLNSEIKDTLSYVRNNIAGKTVVAVDCPSGVDCESGDCSPETIPASLTVCMGAVKTGLVRFPAFQMVGDLEVVDLNFPANISAYKDVTESIVDRNDVINVLPKRPQDAHKGTFGTTLIIAGSINYTGAALLAAKAAYRIGTGLVRLAVPAPLYGPLAGQIPEATWLLLPHDQGIITDQASDIIFDNLRDVDALLLGPGWGVHDSTQNFLMNILLHKERYSHLRRNIGFVNSNKETKIETHPRFPPLVIDADGLKLLVKLDEWHSLIPPGTILTPHPGEMAVMTGLSVQEIQSNREEIARRYATEWGHILVLKGALTVVGSPEGNICIIPVATSALARAGTGDVLAGVLVGLLAQGVPPFQAAVAGSWIHAQAGIKAAEWQGQEASVMAGEVLDAIPEVMQGCYS